MNEEEVSEIRRRLRTEKNNIRSICGRYMNTKDEIISELDQSVALVPQEGAENFISILKKTLSGTPNKNLINMEFSTQQMVDSEEHRLLMVLKGSSLKDEGVIHRFFQNVAASIALDENYLILLTHGTYDVPFRSKNGQIQDSNSTEVYSYILCSVCPVKLTKPVFGYYVDENTFRNCKTDWAVSPPKLGFLFPTFDDRNTDIYSTFYYAQDSSETYAQFVDTVFYCSVPMPATEQKETLQGILYGPLECECGFDTVYAMRRQPKNLIGEHKTNKEEIPLVVSKGHIARILETHGIPRERIESFEEQFNKQLGSGINLSPKNLVETNQLVVTAPNMKIQVNESTDHLMKTRVINGVKYIMIRAEDGIEVSGVPVHTT